MRYLWILPLVLVTGCSSIRYVTTDHGRLVTQDGKPVDMIGNPPLICHTEKGKTYSGYFEYQDEDGTIVLDNFGRGITIIRDRALCELQLDTSVNE